MLLDGANALNLQTRFQDIKGAHKRGSQSSCIVHSTRSS